MSGMYFSAGSSRTTAISHRCANLFVVAALLLSTAAAAIVFHPRSAAAATATTTSALNLRAQGSTSSAVKLVMPAGATVEIVRRLSTGWYRILYQGVGGYAHGDYLSTGGGGGSTSGGGGGSSSGGATGNARTTTSLNLRAGPSTGDRVLLVMPSGATVSLTGETSNGFLRLTYQGTTGWAHGSYIGNAGSSGGSDEDPGSGNAGSARTTTALNLRSGPTTSSRVLLVIPSGATVTLTGTYSGGFQGVTYNGTTGWAYADYLTSGGGTSGGGGGASGPDGSYDANGDGVWQRDEIISIIYSAADYYGQPRGDMLRVAQCESGLDPYNVTPPYNASGLFQFLPGTWASTPYAGQDIFNPVSNAFATGWMWSVGRRGEWVCQ